MKNIKARRINLRSAPERAKYSALLQEFEAEFTYPLGHERFSIKHGLDPSGVDNKQPDYFSFFEQLGMVSYMILEHDGKIVAAICAVLRKTSNGLAWYLCDFKISQLYRNRQLYRKLMWHYFLPHYLRCSSMYGVNMSASHKNALFRHSKNIFKAFSLSIEPRYLSQCSKKELLNSSLNTPSFWDKYYITTNQGKKDIVLGGISMPLYHIVKKEHIISSHTQYVLNDLPDNAQIMYVASAKQNIMNNEIEISVIHRKKSGIYISSAEI